MSAEGNEGDRAARTTPEDGRDREVVGDATSPATTPAATPHGVVCRLCDAAVRAEAVTIELAVTGAGRRPVTSLCPRHVWLAVQRGLPAALLADALGDRIAQLSSPEPSEDGPRAGPRCAVCVAMDKAALSSLARGADAATICMPHAAQALQHGIDVPLGAYFEAGRDLERDLSELIRKADYRFRDESRGAERDSWLRALARVSGAPGVRRPPAIRRRTGTGGHTP